MAGIGRIDRSGQPDTVRVDLHDPRAALGRDWLYLIEGLDDTVLVFEASVHGRWLLHSRHRLQAAADGLESGPAPLVGDPATATHPTYRTHPDQQAGAHHDSGDPHKAPAQWAAHGGLLGLPDPRDRALTAGRLRVGGMIPEARARADRRLPHRG